jgi:hypothetical protein
MVCGTEEREGKKKKLVLDSLFVPTQHNLLHTHMLPSAEEFLLDKIIIKISIATSGSELLGIRAVMVPLSVPLLLFLESRESIQISLDVVPIFAEWISWQDKI